MKRGITKTQRDLINDLLDQGEGRFAIAQRAGVTPGQVSALAAHRTIRARQLSSPSALSGKDILIDEAHAIHGNDTILLGVTRDEKRMCWIPTISANPHMLIVGESGYGKTYATSCLIAELARRQVPTIIFDYGQGFTAESADPIFLREAIPQQLEVGRRGVAISPFQLFATDVHGPLNVAQRIADTLARVYQNLGIQQHALIRQAVLDVLEDVGIHSKVPDSWGKALPRFGLLHKKLLEYALDPTNPDRKTARSAASHIASLFLFDVFRSNGIPIKWGELLERGQRSTIVQLRGLEQNLQRASTEFLLWNLVAYLESVGPQELRCFVVIDEAHRIPSGNGSAIERLLREGRKFGLGMILASQQPEDFTSIALSNTATKLVFQITDEKATITKQLFRKLKLPMPFHQLHRTITTLDRGFAFALTQNRGGVVRISSLNERFSRSQEA